MLSFNALKIIKEIAFFSIFVIEFIFEFLKHLEYLLKQFEVIEKNDYLNNIISHINILLDLLLFIINKVLYSKLKNLTIIIYD